MIKPGLGYGDGDRDENAVYFPVEHFYKLFNRTLTRFTDWEFLAIGLRELERPQWDALLTSLEELVEKIDAGCSLATVEYLVEPFEDWEEDKLCNDRGRFRQEVRDTFSDFTRWAREQLETHETLTVVGF